MPRKKFDLDRRQLMSKYGSFEKWVTAKLYQYGLLDHVFVITSSKIVPGHYKYMWLDTTHSCKEIEMNGVSFTSSAAPDAIYLVHDMNKDDNVQCMLKTLDRKAVRLVVDGLAVI